MESHIRSSRIFSSRIAGTGFALGSMASLQLGAPFAVPVMVAHGSFGITAMRLISAAAVMLLLARPKFTKFNRRQWAGAGALGIIMGLMTLAYFEAVTLMPVGPAITIDFLGPLAVAVVSLQGWPRIALPLLALSGVAAISFGPGGWLFNPAGMCFVLVSACCWAAYIVLMRQLGRLFTGHDGLSVSFIVAALVALPIVLVIDPSGFVLARLPVAAGLAVLAPLIPFSLEMMALRRLDMGTFSILMSLEPVFGAIFGFFILGQLLSIQQIAGIFAVMAASFIAVYLSSAKKTPAFVQSSIPESKVALM